THTFSTSSALSTACLNRSMSRLRCHGMHLANRTMPFKYSTELFTFSVQGSATNAR
ncbi:hypothetical protein Pmar_PMAR029570, partial [Perkinsus marinus ATCC 50983]